MSEQTAESTHNSIITNNVTTTAPGNLESDAPEEKATTLPTYERFLVQTIRMMRKEERTDILNKFYEVYNTILNPQDVADIAVLGSICSAVKELPTELELSRLEKCGKYARATGGFTDCWGGELNTRPGRLVAIKAFRPCTQSDVEKIKEILWNQVPVWKRLSHANILPFHGVDMICFQFSLVYDLEEGSNIIKYLHSHPNTPRPPLFLGVAKGLEYLHGLNITHGRLKGANVVIDEEGNPRLTEYGLEPVYSDDNIHMTITPQTIGMSGWLAPEIIKPHGNPRMFESKEADVFALGMVAVEVFTGKVPFGKMSRETTTVSISKGRRPGKPKNAVEVGLTDQMWKAIQECWREDPNKRPKVVEVVEQWQNFVGGDDVPQQTHVTSESLPPPSGSWGSFDTIGKSLGALIRGLR